MKKRLLSANLYTAPMHSHWLSYVDTEGSTISLLALERKLQNGRRMSNRNTEFHESDDYYELTHQLDLVSGAYIDVLKPCARKMIERIMEDKGIPYDNNDLKYTTNFSSAVANTPENKLSREYYEKGRYHFDSEQGFIEVGFIDVEQQAHEEMNAEVA